MTVSELFASLRELPPDGDVYMEIQNADGSRTTAPLERVSFMDEILILHAVDNPYASEGGAEMLDGRDRSWSGTRLSRPV